MKEIVHPEFEQAFIVVKENPPRGHGKLPERGIFFCDGKHDELEVLGKDKMVNSFWKN